MMKKILLFFLMVSMALIATPAIAKSLVLDYDQIHTIEGEVFLPLRQVAQFAGYIVQYAADEVTLTKKDNQLRFNRTDSTLVNNGHHLYLYSEPSLVSGILYAPKTFFEDHLRLGVKLNQGNVIISQLPETGAVLLNQRETFQDKYLDLQLQYPRLRGLDQKVETQLNSIIAEKVARIKTDAHKDEEDLLANLWSPNAKIEYYLNYLVKRNQGDLLSLVFEDYRYQGGAHGLTAKFAYNFNLKTGKQYFLEGLFSPGEDYVSLLNQKIEEQIRGDRHKSQNYNFDSIAPDQEFYFTNEALVICFQSYEIAAYAEGKPEFAIPLSQLEHVLSPELKELSGRNAVKK